MNLYAVTHADLDYLHQLEYEIVLVTWDSREWFLKGLCTDYFEWMPWNSHVTLLTEDVPLPQNFYNKEEVAQYLPEDWKDKEYVEV